MPNIRKDKLAALLSAGQQMSNICFNLSQQSGNPNARIMKESQVAWDKARLDLKAAKAGEGE